MRIGSPWMRIGRRRLPSRRRRRRRVGPRPRRLFNREPPLLSNVERRHAEQEPPGSHGNLERRGGLAPGRRRRRRRGGSNVRRVREAHRRDRHRIRARRHHEQLPGNEDQVPRTTTRSSSSSSCTVSRRRHRQRRRRHPRVLRAAFEHGSRLVPFRGLIRPGSNVAEERFKHARVRDGLKLEPPELRPGGRRAKAPGHESNDAAARSLRRRRRRVRRVQAANQRLPKFAGAPTPPRRVALNRAPFHVHPQRHRGSRLPSRRAPHGVDGEAEQEVRGQAELHRAPVPVEHQHVPAAAGAAPRMADPIRLGLSSSPRRAVQRDRRPRRVRERRARLRVESRPSPRSSRRRARVLVLVPKGRPRPSVRLARLPANIPGNVTPRPRDSRALPQRVDPTLRASRVRVQRRERQPRASVPRDDVELARRGAPSNGDDGGFVERDGVGDSDVRAVHRRRGRVPGVALLHEEQTSARGDDRETLGPPAAASDGAFGGSGARSGAVSEQEDAGGYDSRVEGREGLGEAVVVECGVPPAAGEPSHRVSERARVVLAAHAIFHGDDGGPFPSFHPVVVVVVTLPMPTRCRGDVDDDRVPPLAHVVLVQPPGVLVHEVPPILVVVLSARLEAHDVGDVHRPHRAAPSVRLHQPVAAGVHPKQARRRLVRRAAEREDDIRWEHARVHRRRPASRPSAPLPMGRPGPLSLSNLSPNKVSKLDSNLRG